MVTEYVTSIKAAWDVAKTLKAATDAIDDASIKLQMAELMNALADAKIEAAENAEKISELEKQLRTKIQLEFIQGKYFKSSDSEEKVGPFCPTCYDSDSKEIRLQHVPGSIYGDWNCRVCKGSFR